MFDPVSFGAKLQKHRKGLVLTQNELAERLGVSPQAVSKWENGDCLPDCWNLKQLADAYGISLDILLDLDSGKDLVWVAGKVEQLATEYVWTASEGEGYGYSRLGSDLWELTKSIYFVEVGDRALQQQDKAHGKTRFASPYGLKVWDDDGIACIIAQGFADGFTSLSADDAEAMAWLLSPPIFGVIRFLRASEPLSAAQLADLAGLAEKDIGTPLLHLVEREYIDIVRSPEGPAKYRLSDRRGIVVWLLLSAARLRTTTGFNMSRYEAH